MARHRFGGSEAEVEIVSTYRKALYELQKAQKLQGGAPDADRDPESAETPATGHGRGGGKKGGARGRGTGGSAAATPAAA